jgi:murein DD-endopeptidase MepM/ murein hydrolase activator NlpD
VTITHDDRTVAVYGHLKQNGSLVKVGDHVEQGQVFALSGNSGASEEPHLHFHVSPDIKSLDDESLPVTFRNTTPNPRGLERGTEYPALAY